MIVKRLLFTTAMATNLRGKLTMAMSIIYLSLELKMAAVAMPCQIIDRKPNPIHLDLEPPNARMLVQVPPHVQVNHSCCANFI